MSTIVSDPNAIYKCFIHSFETPDVGEWLQHKVDNIHYEVGVSVCIYCKKRVKFDSLVQQSTDNLVPAICPICAPKNEAEPNCELIPERKKPAKVVWDGNAEDAIRDINCGSGDEGV